VPLVDPGSAVGRVQRCASSGDHPETRHLQGFPDHRIIRGEEAQTRGSGNSMKYKVTEPGRNLVRGNKKESHIKLSFF